MTKHTVIISSTQDWICPANVRAADVTVVGPGGPGHSGAEGDGTHGGTGGGGGKSGAVVTLNKFALSPGFSYPITVGTNSNSSSAFGYTAVAGAEGSPGSLQSDAYTYGTVGNPGESGLTSVAGYPAASNGGNNGRGVTGGSGGSGWGAGGGGGAGGDYEGIGRLAGAGGPGAPGVVIITYYTPDVTFSADSTSGLSPKTVEFTGAGTETPTEWYWDFGDGETSDVQNPSHTYTTTGKKTVSLTVTNAYSVVTLAKTDYITLLWKPTSHATLIDSDPWRR